MGQCFDDRPNLESQQKFRKSDVTWVFKIFFLFFGGGEGGRWSPHLGIFPLYPVFSESIPYEDASFELQFERVLCSSFKKSIYSKSFIVNQFFQILSDNKNVYSTFNRYLFISEIQNISIEEEEEEIDSGSRVPGLWTKR